MMKSKRQRQEADDLERAAKDKVLSAQNERFRNSTLARRVCETLRCEFAQPDDTLKKVVKEHMVKDEDLFIDDIEEDGAVFALGLNRAPKGLSNVYLYVMETKVTFNIEPIGDQVEDFEEEVRELQLL